MYLAAQMKLLGIELHFQKRTDSSTVDLQCFEQCFQKLQTCLLQAKKDLILLMIQSCKGILQF